jgi:hypothetical protein
MLAWVQEQIASGFGVLLILTAFFAALVIARDSAAKASFSDG